MKRLIILLAVILLGSAFFISWSPEGLSNLSNSLNTNKQKYIHCEDWYFNHQGVVSRLKSIEKDDFNERFHYKNSWKELSSGKLFFLAYSYLYGINVNKDVRIAENIFLEVEKREGLKPLGITSMVEVALIKILCKGQEVGSVYGDFVIASQNGSVSGSYFKYLYDTEVLKKNRQSGLEDIVKYNMDSYFPALMEVSYQIFVEGRLDDKELQAVKEHDGWNDCENIFLFLRNKILSKAGKEKREDFVRKLKPKIFAKCFSTKN